MNLPFKISDFQLGQERPVFLACIGLSLLIWFFVKLSKNYQTEKIIQFEYVLPDKMEFTEHPPHSLLATVSGTGVDLVKKFITQRIPVVAVEIAGLPDRANQKSELMSLIQHEIGLEVININRSYLLFSIDSTATKKVPVVLDAVFNFKNDFFQDGPIHPIPDSVLLAGPKQELDQIDRVLTQRRTFKNIDRSLNELLPFQPTGFEHVKAFPDQVALQISVQQYTEKMMDVSIHPLNALQGFQINPDKVTLYCTVSLSRYDELTADSFHIIVDLEHASQTTKALSIVPIELSSQPDWVRSVRIDPKTVEFLIVE